MPGFAGAFLAGSVVWLADGAEVPPTSDVDVMVVVTDPSAARRPGKRLHRGVLLDVTYLARDRVASAERVLGDHHLAGALHAPGVLVDPTGWLTELQAAVARDYAQPAWVRRRCESAMRTVRRFAGSLDVRAPLDAQVISCVFAAGVTAHVLLVAGLRNPTVRTRYAAVRTLLEERGRLDLHEALLAVAGCDATGRAAVEQRLDALAEAFDAAAAVRHSPFSFESDLTLAARPIAIDGSHELVARGLHREAMFWIAVTQSRCHAVLRTDAPPEVAARFEPAYERLLADLGLATWADRESRVAAIEAFLPRLEREAEAIIDRPTPE